MKRCILAILLLFACRVCADDLEVAFSNATKITHATATINAGLVAIGDTNPVCFFYWGTTNSGTNIGSWGFSTNLGTQVVGKVSADITSLSSNTTYYYRLYATNAATAWAPIGSFVTLTHPITGTPAGGTGDLSKAVADTLYEPIGVTLDGVSQHGSNTTASLTLGGAYNLLGYSTGTEAWPSTASKAALNLGYSGGYRTNTATASINAGVNIGAVQSIYGTATFGCVNWGVLGSSTTKKQLCYGDAVGSFNLGVETRQQHQNGSYASLNWGGSVGGYQYNSGKSALNWGYFTGDTQYQTNTAYGAWAVGRDNRVTHDFSFVFGVGLDSVDTNAIHARKLYLSGVDAESVFAPAGVTSNMAVLIPGSTTNWLCITNGAIMAITDTQP